MDLLVEALKTLKEMGLYQAEHIAFLLQKVEELEKRISELEKSKS
jgi:hypothetical protein